MRGVTAHPGPVPRVGRRPNRQRRDFCRWVREQTTQLDVLINNAGGAKGLDPVAQGKDDDWEFMLQTNVLGVLRMTRAVLPLLTTNPGSTILNIGSIAGRVVYEGGAATAPRKPPNSRSPAPSALSSAARACGSALSIPVSLRPSSHSCVSTGMPIGPNRSTGEPFP